MLYSGYGGAITFIADHQFNVGDRIVYSGATGVLEQFNGTYTVSSSYPGQFGIWATSSFSSVPAIYNFNPDGTITLAP